MKEAKLVARFVRGGKGGNCSAISDRNSVSTFQLVYFIIVWIYF